MCAASAPLFDCDRFVAACRAAVAESSPEKAMREVVAEAVADPAAVLRTLGEPIAAGLQTLYHGPDLTIINVIWAPQMTVRPHNHRMWAVIGVYEGREDNIFWRRLRDRAGGRVEAAGAKELCAADAVPLGRDIIHSVTNPVPRYSAGIHVYGGDFFAAERSEWDPATLLEQPYSGERTRQDFAEANRRWVAAG
jgi:predicted metal-dependent enzyme (double-stranded beta helix superfamily)